MGMYTTCQTCFPKFSFLYNFCDETIPFTEQLIDHCIPKYNWRPHEEDEDTAAVIIFLSFL